MTEKAKLPMGIEDFEEMRSVIGDEALRFSFLSESDRLTETERQQYAKLIELDDRGEYAMSDELLSKSFLMLTRFLQKHYGQKTILLIDECDKLLSCP